MPDLVPSSAPAPSAPSALALLTDPAGGTTAQRLSAFAKSGTVRKLLPAFVGMAALGGAALAWSSLAPAPQRMLYSDLDDSNRAAITPLLDQAGIDYSIDNATGALTVAEDDFYKARMLVAGDGGLATPESGAEMLDSLPMGASRMMEGERLRAARERDLMLTIREIDGVESARVNIAEGEQSAFVRDTIAPSASVMLRLARGKQLSQGQVAAVVNLVAASVPGLTPEAVRVADQQGRLLSDPTSQQSDRLDLQSRMEQKLRDQLSRLLAPMLGEGNFSTEIQVELDMDEVTRAREAYDKDGVVRSETSEASTASAPGAAIGVPGATSNTPPPAAQPADRPPQGTQAPGASSTTNGQSRSARTYELGREVSVANTAPGGIKRMTVAVAVSKGAMKGAKPADIAQIEKLVSSAVGANPQRGDAVTVVVRKFEPVMEEELPFYETGWFAGLVRQGSALLAVLLVLLFAVRPLMRMLRGNAAGEDTSEGELAERGEGEGPFADDGLVHAVSDIVDRERLDAKVGLARRMVSEQPDSAVAALRLMLSEDAARTSSSQSEAPA